ncbi:MinD/ParA family protein [Zafaria sp. J156]|uniref:MinD/ParA family ATP-binding protein n=1 Tax=Zafaria sp. J156 TaxID=3116490 RepID=UPI002E798277|nr:MinD/ParA family protein [Zafaria sp. J156]MEE1622155.1 MinD/ParA family protein [Zafaria sp. J156]
MTQHSSIPDEAPDAARPEPGPEGVAEGRDAADGVREPQDGAAPADGGGAPDPDAVAPFQDDAGTPPLEAGGASATGADGDPVAGGGTDAGEAPDSAAEVDVPGPVPSDVVLETGDEDDAAAQPTPGRASARGTAPEAVEGLGDWEPVGGDERQPTASGAPARAAADASTSVFPARRAAGAAAQGASASSPAEPAPAPAPEPEPAAALTADRLLQPRNRAPVGGWRLWLYRATLGRVNVGDSDAVRLRRITEHQIAAPLEGGTRYVPVLSRKGGVGKTTVTTLLGMALAHVREDRVIALDANPDRGTLSDRSPGRARYTARQLVQNRFMVDSFSKLSSYASREGSRLHVLASDTDPHVAEAFDDADYRAVTDLLSRFYSIVLTDSGTGMVHSVMKGTLEKANAVVLVSGASVDEARLASETLSWLEAHGREDLARRAIVVINQSAGPGRGVNVEEIEAHFQTRVQTVVRLPYDPHLAEGSRVDLQRLRPATREAAMELAALVVAELKG